MFEKILPEDAMVLSAKGLLKIVDIREPVELLLSGTVPGAVHVPYAAARRDPSSIAGSAVICKTGRRSAILSMAAHLAGIRLINVEGGVTAWDAAGLPMVEAQTVSEEESPEHLLECKNCSPACNLHPLPSPP